ncbi:MAG: GGDEF domain-containing protein [Nitrosomonas halophila]
MHDIAPTDSDAARFLQIVRAAGLNAEHGRLACQLRSGFLNAHAEALVDNCLAALAEDQDFLSIKQVDRGHTLRQGWIDLLRSFGQNFDSPGYLVRRLTFFAACARAGMPLNLLLLQHSLIQRNVVERIAVSGVTTSDAHKLTDCALRIGALDLYLVAEGYHLPEIDALRKSLQALRGEVSHLRWRTSVDQLTGLVSYSKLVEILAQQIDLAQARRQPLSLIMADLDFFKSINDTYGHLVGDLVLRHTAERIQAAVRDFDIVGRFGGEEFTVILKNTDIEMAGIIGERIRAEIAGGPIHVKALNISITISLGVAMLRQDETMEALLERADAAMYQAKRAGRNRVVIAT